jgi:hypothetical protein
MIQTKVVEKPKHIFYVQELPTPPPRKSWCVLHNVKIYCRAGQATDDNMVHSLCMLDTEGYKHTLAVCIVY